MSRHYLSSYMPAFTEHPYVLPLLHRCKGHLSNNTGQGTGAGGGARSFANFGHTGLGMYDGHNAIDLSHDANHAS